MANLPRSLSRVLIRVVSIRRELAQHFLRSRYCASWCGASRTNLGMPEILSCNCCPTLLQRRSSSWSVETDFTLKSAVQSLCMKLCIERDESLVKGCG